MAKLWVSSLFGFAGKEERSPAVRPPARRGTPAEVKGMLLQRRKQCRCAAGRARPSQLVQKHLHRHMRQTRNAKLNAILD